MKKDVIIHYAPTEIGDIAFRKVSKVDTLDWDKAILLAGNGVRRTRKGDDVADWLIREHGGAVFEIEKKLYRIRYTYEAYPHTDGYVITDIFEIDKARHNTVIVHYESNGAHEWDTPYVENCNIVNPKEGFTTRIKNISERDNMVSVSYVYWRENYDMKHIPIPAPDMF